MHSLLKSDEVRRKIQTFASMVIDRDYENLSEGGKTYFNRMQASAAKMQLLINDLLSYSRTSNAAGKREVTELSKIIDAVKDELKEELARKNAVIETGELPAVNVVPFQFRQLLNNLFRNSLKFSKPDVATRITIKNEKVSVAAPGVDALQAGKQYYHISITDNGIGFEPQYNEKIFEVFQRLHADSEYPGTGIGLAIVKKIIENHNGYISATGTLDIGATFNIYIPVE